MTPADGTTPVTLEAEEGPRLSSGAIVKGESEWTDGNFCAMQQDVVPGLFTPVHRHEHETQTQVVLSGTLGFWVEGGEEVVLGPGGYHFRPQGLLHALWNPTDEPARLLEITSPATSFMQWMRDLDEMMAGEPASRAEVAERAAAAGITFDAEATEWLCQRVGLSQSNVFGED